MAPDTPQAHRVEPGSGEERSRCRCTPIGEFIRWAPNADPPIERLTSVAQIHAAQAHINSKMLQKREPRKLSFLISTSRSTAELPAWATASAPLFFRRSAMRVRCSCSDWVSSAKNLSSVSISSGGVLGVEVVGKGECGAATSGSRGRAGFGGGVYVGHSHPFVVYG